MISTSSAKLVSEIQSYSFNNNPFDGYRTIDLIIFFSPLAVELFLRLLAAMEPFITIHS